MIGALAGDIIGSRFEWNNHRSVDFKLLHKGCFFTDDSVLTVALAESILTGDPYARHLKSYYKKYPDAGYGGMFSYWAESSTKKAYNSYGNGAAMRISPAGFAFATLEETLAKAEEFTAVTHNHPEGIKGAQATAAAIFMARNGSTKDQIRTYVGQQFGYDLNRTCDEIRPGYTFNETCQGTVPEAIIAFLESDSFEHAIRLGISLGGDSDTLACITGGIAEAFYGGVPDDICMFVYDKLDESMRSITRQFTAKYCM